MPDKPEPAPARPAVVAGALVIRPLAHQGLQLSGEADINGRDALRDALRGVPAGGADDFHLGLARLRFIDVSCAGEIIAAAERCPAARVVLHDPPPGLLHIVGLMRPEASLEWQHFPVVRCMVSLRPGSSIATR